MKATFHGQLYDEQITIERVNKQKAKRLFNEGKTIYLQSCNMYPFGVWQSLCPIDSEKGDFDQICNEYGYYNLDNERGKYIHFYIKTK